MWAAWHRPPSKSLVFFSHSSLLCDHHNTNMKSIKRNDYWVSLEFIIHQSVSKYLNRTNWNGLHKILMASLLVHFINEKTKTQGAVKQITEDHRLNHRVLMQEVPEIHATSTALSVAVTLVNLNTLNLIWKKWMSSLLIHLGRYDYIKDLDMRKWSQL